MTTTTKAKPAPNGVQPSARMVTIDYGGHTYSFDADEISIEALENFEDGQYIRACRSILGPEQWAAYKARHPRAVDVNDFVNALLRGTAALGNS
jgi:hypothetical protein